MNNRNSSLAFLDNCIKLFENELNIINNRTSFIVNKVMNDMKQYKKENLSTEEIIKDFKKYYYGEFKKETENFKWYLNLQKIIINRRKKMVFISSSSKGINNKEECVECMECKKTKEYNPPKKISKKEIESLSILNKNLKMLSFCQEEYTEISKRIERNKRLSEPIRDDMELKTILEKKISSLKKEIEDLSKKA